MRRHTRIVIQGYPGSYHHEAAREYFGARHIECIPARSFEILGQTLREDQGCNYAVMAIENSIAGSILQNYRILRENEFWISGEVYLRVSHQLLGLPGQTIQDIRTVESHPMAIYQCYDFLNQHKHIGVVESADTALSAQRVAEQGLSAVAAIASRLAAKEYGLEILASDIETSKANYTRFFIISREAQYASLGNANKASIYLRVPHQHGSLLKVLQVISDDNINLSKLQSFPVTGELNNYYFHLDLEFEHISQYENCIDQLKSLTTGLEELGVYTKAAIYDHQHVK
ncbi:MAG: prephenate dehydratase [Bacteroidota bacterium]